MYMDAVNYISDVLRKTKGKELKVAFFRRFFIKGRAGKKRTLFCFSL